MTASFGVWLAHKEHDFHYNDPTAVAAQKENARRAILHGRNSPALLLWGPGNEIENGQEDDPRAARSTGASRGHLYAFLENLPFYVLALPSTGVLKLSAAFTQ